MKVCIAGDVAVSPMSKFVSSKIVVASASLARIARALGVSPRDTGATRLASPVHTTSGFV
jgi:predicted RecB family nuclease